MELGKFKDPRYLRPLMFHAHHEIAPEVWISSASTTATWWNDISDTPIWVESTNGGVEPQK